MGITSTGNYLKCPSDFEMEEIICNAKEVRKQVELSQDKMNVPLFTYTEGFGGNERVKISTKQGKPKRHRASEPWNDD